MRPLARLPLAGALVVLAALVVGGIYLELRVGSLPGLVAALAAAALFGAFFLYDYHERPRAGPAVAAAAGRPFEVVGPAGAAEVGFVDPVLAADRIAAGEVRPEGADEAPPADGSGPVGP